jgi:hypothetical protein
LIGWIRPLLKFTKEINRFILSVISLENQIVNIRWNNGKELTETLSSGQPIKQ